ncbi:MAG: hypothetical protein J5965_07320 [Aeriscardovia sp.]|nr:hypothetical protein [Aeriscardovia sp.]
MDFIRFIVDGQRLDYDRKYYSSTDTIDTLYCNFKFITDDLGHVRGGWDLPFIWAQFHDEKGNVYVKEVTADNTCSIPFECLRQLKFKMTLFATDTEDYMTCKKRYTTNEIAFRFKGDANINYDGGVSPDEPMPTNWQILLDRVDTCKSTVDGLLRDVSSMQSTVDELSAELTNESTARANEDTRIEGLINAESTARESADADLRLLINDEINERISSDNALQNSINSLDIRESEHYSDCMSKMSNLDGRVTANASAIDGINTTVDGLNTRLDAEATARETADANLQSAINNRYTKAETDTLLNTKQGSLSESQLAAVNSGLTSSDKTTLDGLSQSVPTIEDRVNGIDSRVTTNTNAIAGVNTAVDNLNTELANESTSRANADADLQLAIQAEEKTRSEKDIDESIALKIVINSVANIEFNRKDESHTVTLTNTASYPFNNSLKTIALDNTHSTNNYIVDANVISADGLPGEIVVFDKLINGFKVKYEGSAKSVTVKLNIAGGM